MKPGTDPDANSIAAAAAVSPICACLKEGTENVRVRLRINKNVERVRMKISLLERDDSMLHSKEFVKKAVASSRLLSQTPPFYDAETS